jgi:hypothetical protein
VETYCKFKAFKTVIILWLQEVRGKEPHAPPICECCVETYCKFKAFKTVIILWLQEVRGKELHAPPICECWFALINRKFVSQSAVI